MTRKMRRNDRKVTDPVEIQRILDEARVLHLAMIDGETPYVLPMNYGYALEQGRLTLYLHSAMQGRKLEVLAKNPRVSFCMECDLVPITGATACKYGMAFASIVGSGHARLVTEPEEKRTGLALLMTTQTGQEVTFTDEMAATVAVICITVEEYAAKKRPLPEEIR